MENHDDSNDNTIELDDIEDTYYNSKESRFAKVIRTKVYHTFIAYIRTDIYDHDPSLTIPDHLSEMSWMDGPSTQFKSTTSKDMMNSASQDIVEQAVETKPNFKLVKKKNFKRMPNPKIITNPIVILLEKLKRLVTNEVGSGDIVRF